MNNMTLSISKEISESLKRYIARLSYIQIIHIDIQIAAARIVVNSRKVLWCTMNIHELFYEKSPMTWSLNGWLLNGCSIYIAPSTLEKKLTNVHVQLRHRSTRRIFGWGNSGAARRSDTGCGRTMNGCCIGLLNGLATWAGRSRKLVPRSPPRSTWTAKVSRGVLESNMFCRTVSNLILLVGVGLVTYHIITAEN